MRSTLRKLHRRLVLERAQVECSRLTGELLHQWSCASANGQPLPDPLAFIQRLCRAGFYLPTLPTGASYLYQCRHDGSIPDEQRLWGILLPWADNPGR